MIVLQSADMYSGLPLSSLVLVDCRLMLRDDWLNEID